MLDQPLQSFSPPSFLSFLPNNFSSGVFTTWALYAILAFWIIYTLVAVYHWLKYSHSSWVAFPAIAIHLFVSLALISYALFGNVSLLTHFLP
jgi:hypothetical protein